MTTAPLHPDYPAFLAALKERILHARTSAARAVNHELVQLYWDIGRGIVEKQRTAGWGDSVVEVLARDLRAEFPDMRGFSARSLWDMRRFFEAYGSSDFLRQAAAELAGSQVGASVRKQAAAKLTPGAGRAEFRRQPVAKSAESAASQQLFLPQLVAEIPWGHHRLILDKLTDPAARLYYLRATAQLGWSRNVLLNQIKAGAYERAVKEKKTHNFALALPEHLAEQADAEGVTVGATVRLNSEPRCLRPRTIIRSSSGTTGSSIRNEGAGNVTDRRRVCSGRCWKRREVRRCRILTGPVVDLAPFWRS